MPALALRENECALCQGRFTLLSGDLMVPEPHLCDECLREVWGLDSETLVRRTTGHLAGQDRMPVENIVQHLQGLKSKWKSVEEAIRAREREHGALE